MREITLEELLEAGCHFGHQVTRHNPKSRDYVFEARDNIHIIDLAKTKEGLETAGAFVKKIAQQSPDTAIIVVGTKRQAKPVIDEEVKRVEEVLGTENPSIFFVTTRWIGGTFTNFTEIAKNTKKLKDLEFRLKSDEAKERYTKKEIGMWEKSRVKLESMYGGVKNMKAKPTLLFIIDAHLEHLAVREAIATHVPTVAMVDTNADPTLIDYPIPANDDAVGSIKLITTYIIDAWIEGKKEEKKNQEIESKKAEEKTDAAVTETKEAAPKKPEKKKKETSKEEKVEKIKKPAKEKKTRVKKTT